MSKTFKIIIGVVVIVVVLALVYSIFSSGDSNSSDQAVNTVSFSSLNPNSPTPVPNEAARLVRMLQNLENIELDGAIFSDPAFLVLIDFSKIIAPIDNYRQNPFAPIGVGNGRRVVNTGPSQSSIGSQDNSGVDQNADDNTGVGDDSEFIGS